jgi:hypothetical protein
MGPSEQYALGGTVACATFALALVFFGLAASIATAVFPSAKLFLEFALHASPLVMCYLVWSIWGANGSAAM